MPNTARRRRWVPLAVALLGLALVAVAGWRRLAAGTSDGLSHALLFGGLLVAVVGVILSLRLSRSQQSAEERHEATQAQP